MAEGHDLIDRVAVHQSANAAVTSDEALLPVGGPSGTEEPRRWTAPLEGAHGSHLQATGSGLTPS
jgi:hypothetical protein